MCELYTHFLVCAFKAAIFSVHWKLAMYVAVLPNGTWVQRIMLVEKQRVLQNASGLWTKISTFSRFRDPRQRQLLEQDPGISLHLLN